MNSHTQRTTGMRARKGLILFFLCFGGMIAPLPAAEEITSITILTFSGKVEISRRPNVWDPGHTNQVLQVGDRLRTGKNSRATVRLSDGTTIKVGAEANLLVPEQKRGGGVKALCGVGDVLLGRRACWTGLIKEQ